MNKKKVYCLSVIIIFSLALLLQNLYLPGVLAKEQGKSITILFTHDMHDNLLPFQTREDGRVVTLGGYARLKSAIEEQKKEDPEALLVDGGDFSMGTAFQTIFNTDAPELRMLGALGYDATTFGNHEFDYRPAGLAESLEAALASGDSLPVIVQSNMSYPADQSGKLTKTLAELKKATEDYGVKDYTVLERKGIRIGIFGLMGEEAASMAPMSEVTFRDEVTEAKRVVKLLKEQEKVDFIVCLSHSGTSTESSASEDQILAKKVPQINAIISGHTHTKLAKPIVVGNTVIGSAEDYGKNLGVIKMKKNTDNQWSLDTYELVPITDSLPEDSTIAKKIEDFKKTVQDKYFSRFDLGFDEVIAKSKLPFQTPEEIVKLHQESTIGNLIGDAYIYAVKKAEGEQYVPITAAVVPCGTIRNTIFKGNITVADAFSISSLGIGADGLPGYPLISVYLTGRELKTICEVDASIAPIMPDAQLYITGLCYTFNPNRLIFNKVEKVSLMSLEGTEGKLEDNKLYRVVCNLYSAQMLSVVGKKSHGLMSLVPKAADGKAITDYESNIIYDAAGQTKTELKEWYAVVQYLQSFDKSGGVPVIPASYEKTQGRKIVDHSKKFFNLVKNPNAIALTVYIGAPILLILVALFIRMTAKRMKKRKERKGKKG